MTSLRRRRSRAQGVLEYSLIIALVGLVVIAILTVVGQRTAGALCNVKSSLAGNHSGCSVVAFGQNSFGQLGIGNTTDPTLTATKVGGLASTIVDVAGASAHSAALMGDGTVRTWGRNQVGQLGNGTQTDSSTPATVSGLSGVVAVAATHGSDTAAVKSDGTVWTWGSNYNGQLGNNNSCASADPCLGSTTPVQVVGPGGSGFLTNIVDIDGLSEDFAALRSDGTVWTWGRNLYGELGTGASCPTNPCGSNVPVQVVGPGGSGFLTGITQLAVNGVGVYALRSDGTVWAWGSNVYGNLGNGSSVCPVGTGITNAACDTTSELQAGSSGVPVPVSGLTQITAIDAGTHLGVALRRDGTVWTWGTNGNGQLGIGTTCTPDPSNACTGTLTPVQVTALSGVRGIGAGGWAAGAILGDGRLATWGWNISGQLGQNGTTDLSTPSTVPGISNVAAVTGGNRYMLVTLFTP